MYLEGRFSVFLHVLHGIVQQGLRQVRSRVRFPSPRLTQSLPQKVGAETEDICHVSHLPKQSNCSVHETRECSLYFQIRALSFFFFTGNVNGETWKENKNPARAPTLLSLHLLGHFQYAFKSCQRNAIKLPGDIKCNAASPGPLRRADRQPINAIRLVCSEEKELT